MERIGMDVIQMEEQALTGRALRSLANIVGLKIYGIKDPDSPRFGQKVGVIVFELKGILSSRVAKDLAEWGGIGVRSGCHCSHILIKHLVGVSPLLVQFQWLMLSLLPKLSLPGLVRVSFGIENSEEDVDTLIHFLDNIAKKPRTLVKKQSTSTHKGTSPPIPCGYRTTDDRFRKGRRTESLLSRLAELHQKVSSILNCI